MGLKVWGLGFPTPNGFRPFRADSGRGNVTAGLSVSNLAGTSCYSSNTHPGDLGARRARCVLGAPPRRRSRVRRSSAKLAVLSGSLQSLCDTIASVQDRLVGQRLNFHFLELSRALRVMLRPAAARSASPPTRPSCCLWHGRRRPRVTELPRSGPAASQAVRAL